MNLLFLVFSFSALIISFFHLAPLPVDAAWIAIVLCGLPIVKGAVVGLVTEFDIKADVLVSIALIASITIGETFAAGEVAFIMAIGAYLEERTVAKARAGIEKLVHLTPATARVVHQGEESVIPAEQVKPGDILRVLAGETIAVDGAIIRGQTSIDQSVMTGESLPVDKGEGDEVFSGTVNQFGTFDMIAQKVGEDSSLQRMIRLVESADAGKAKIVGLADRWATWIVVIALLAALVTWLATGEIIRAVTILVVFCPCALVLATPTAIMAGIGNATRYGILVRQGDALERLAQVKRVAFDKTGTLTWGKPSVVQIQSWDPALDGAALLELAAISELRSGHPLGKAIVACYKQKNGSLPEQPEDFRLLAGRGVYAVCSGEEICAGNRALFVERNISLPNGLVRAAEKAKAEGSTVVYLARNGQTAGFIALSDTLRPDAAQTVGAIHQTDTRTVLLTGDTEQAASHIAQTAAIKEVWADCLPENKLEAIRIYQQRGELVCMVGDGINDAPDIVLVGDEIKAIPHLLQLAKKTMQTIKINLTASLTLNFIAIGLAISGILNPVSGALVHNAGSVAVILNSSLLLKFNQEHRGGVL